MAPEEIAAVVVECPLGLVLLEATELGLCRLAFIRERGGAGRAEGAPPATQDILRGAAEQLEAYWAGKRLSFDLPLDLAGTPFQRAVWAAARVIPFGETRSYGQLARQIGRPGAARAVGAALGANPVPLVVPCHRVLRADGALGGYSGGLEIKRALLAHEGHESVAR